MYIQYNKTGSLWKYKSQYGSVLTPVKARVRCIKAGILENFIISVRLCWLDVWGNFWQQGTIYTVFAKDVLLVNQKATDFSKLWQETYSFSVNNRDFINTLKELVACQFTVKSVYLPGCGGGSLRGGVGGRGRDSLPHLPSQRTHPPHPPNLQSPHYHHGGQEGDCSSRNW